MQQKPRRLLSLRGTFAHLYCVFESSSSVRTVTVGPGIITGSTTTVARGLDQSVTDLTAGRGFHPAPKIVYSIVDSRIIAATDDMSRWFVFNTSGAIVRRGRFSAGKARTTGTGY